jgi:hypothetical protein
MPAGYERLRDALKRQGKSDEEAKTLAAAIWNKHHKENPVTNKPHEMENPMIKDIRTELARPVRALRPDWVAERAERELVNSWPNAVKKLIMDSARQDSRWIGEQRVRNKIVGRMAAAKFQKRPRPGRKGIHWLPNPTQNVAMSVIAPNQTELGSLLGTKGNRSSLGEFLEHILTEGSKKAGLIKKVQNAGAPKYALTAAEQKALAKKTAAEIAAEQRARTMSTIEPNQILLGVPSDMDERKARHPFLASAAAYVGAPIPARAISRSFMNRTGVISGQAQPWTKQDAAFRESVKKDLASHTQVHERTSRYGPNFTPAAKKDSFIGKQLTKHGVPFSETHGSVTVTPGTRTGLKAGILAHEAGHATQPKLLRSPILRAGGALAGLGGLGTTLISSEQERGKLGAQVATAGTAPVLAAEVDASIRGIARMRRAGYKGLKSLSPGAGLVTYGAAAAVPTLAYKIKKGLGGYKPPKEMSAIQPNQILLGVGDVIWKKRPIAKGFFRPMTQERKALPAPLVRHPMSPNPNPNASAAMPPPNPEEVGSLPRILDYLKKRNAPTPRPRKALRRSQGARGWFPERGDIRDFAALLPDVIEA